MVETNKHIREYSYSDDRGYAQAVVYHLFPGVDVAYTSVHMADFDFLQAGREFYLPVFYADVRGTLTRRADGYNGNK